MIKKVFLKIYPIFTVLLVIFLWWIASLIINIEFLLPSPFKTFSELLEILKSGKFYVSCLNTLANSLLSFLLSFIFALIFAIISSISKVFEKLLHPLITIVRVMPTMSVIFLSIIWLTGQSTFLIVFLVIFPMLYTNFLSSIKSVDGNLLNMTKVYNVSKKDTIIHLFVPYVVKNSYENCVSTLTFAVKLSISGEAIAKSGMTLGFLMQSANVSLETGELIAYTVIAVILGFFVEFIIRMVAKLILKIRRNYAKTK